MENGSNKPVAVVVGVGPGLGAAVARGFSMSYSIGILARKAEYLHELAHELRRGGSKVLDVACDVA